MRSGPSTLRQHGSSTPAKDIYESPASTSSTWEKENGPAGRQGGSDGPVVVKLGTWLDNVRKRAAKLPEQRRADLDQLGMRW
ncbi:MULTISPECIES: helicase associated domain-containing protein [Streptomyces]|uniref:helicase associated domain-containing protein n=1 Tax=Streptomyces TaxID=1883 RepID=UPI0021A8060E|nr:helicase associated domain-containing protein [Streptomyces atratus]MCT2544092.1 helicase associated domain-containing protein [Streptomyces atratus]